MRLARGWSCLVLAGLMCVTCAGQQTPGDKTGDKAGDKRKEEKHHEPATEEEARTALRTAEAEHPGNSAEVAVALMDLETVQVAMSVTDETLEIAMRAVKVAEAAAGKESSLYAEAVADESTIYLMRDRPDLARPLAEEAVAIERRIEPNPSGMASAAAALSAVCKKEGDLPCALRNVELQVKMLREVKDGKPIDLVSGLIDLVDDRKLTDDAAGARAAMEEVLTIAAHDDETEPSWAIVESNAGAFFLYTGENQRALEHLKKALELDIRLHGADSVAACAPMANLAYAERAVGDASDALTHYGRARVLCAQQYGPNHSVTGLVNAGYALALSSLGRYPEAVQVALEAHRASREYIRLAIRLLPERQALTVGAEGSMSFSVLVTVATRHPEAGVAEVYQEVVRSRALVAEEMAQRQAGLGRKHDPAVSALEAELETERKAVMQLEGPGTSATDLTEATAKMERTERELAERSSAFRTDERTRSSELADLRKNLPAGSVLVSYVAYDRFAPESGKFDALIPSYMAFVMRPDSDRIGAYDLGDGKTIVALVDAMRASAEGEAHAGGLGSMRNERIYREAAEKLRQRIWDPLKAEVGQAKLALVVADGVLNLFPFGALPQGTGYLVERGPVVHMLTSERDLVPAEKGERRSGLLAVGNPSFLRSESPRSGAASAAEASAADRSRGTGMACETFGTLEFDPLPGSLNEVMDVSSMWQRWNADEPKEVLTGERATRSQFIEGASRARILHVATHAFVLDKSCGNGNPLLHSGLVFAGVNQRRDASILTAQQIASLDLRGVDWAVLSACNTGYGDLKDGEGVLGLERSFRVAGAKSVVMTLWPVDDAVTGHFMHLLYAERFGGHATTADAVWDAARKMLRERRAAGKSTHPWYWAGFVGAGGWK